MVKKTKAKKEIKGAIEKEPMNAPANEGVYELINGYAIVVGGDYKEFIGDKKIAFGEAIKAYGLIKGV